MKKCTLTVMPLKLSSSIMIFTLSTLLLLSGCVTTNITSVDQAKGEPIATGAPLSGVTVYLSPVAESKNLTADRAKEVTEQAEDVLQQYGATIVNSEAEAKLIIEFTKLKDTTQYNNILVPALGMFSIMSGLVIPVVAPIQYQIEITAKLNNSYRQQLLLKQTTSIKSIEIFGWFSRLFCGGNYPEYCGVSSPRRWAALIKTMNEIVEMKRNGDF